MINCLRAMEKILILWVVLITVGLCSSSIEIFDDFQKCRAGPEFNNCLTKAMNILLPQLKDGSKHLDIEPLEPLRIPDSVYEPQSTGAVRIRQEFEKTYLHNFGTKTTFTEVEADLDKNTISVELNNPLIKMNGDYKIRGKILLLPVNSDGNYYAEFRNVNVKFTFKFKKVKRDGNTYWHFNTVETYMKPGEILLNAENLVRGQKELSAELNRLINDNWRELWEDIEPTYAKVIGGIVLNILNKAFKHIPVDKILMDA